MSVRKLKFIYIDYWSLDLIQLPRLKISKSVFTLILFLLIFWQMLFAAMALVRTFFSLTSLQVIIKSARLFLLIPRPRLGLSLVLAASGGWVARLGLLAAPGCRSQLLSVIRLWSIWDEFFFDSPDHRINVLILLCSISLLMISWFILFKDIILLIVIIVIPITIIVVWGSLLLVLVDSGSRLFVWWFPWW